MVQIEPSFLFDDYGYLSHHQFASDDIIIDVHFYKVNARAVISRI